RWEGEPFTEEIRKRDSSILSSFRGGFRPANGRKHKAKTPRTKLERGLYNRAPASGFTGSTRSSGVRYGRLRPTVAIRQPAVTGFSEAAHRRCLPVSFKETKA
ncbi:hypothetical protein B296_00057271, partial [Ensete ventricosum]